jgi:hypothetical protein
MTTLFNQIDPTGKLASMIALTDKVREYTIGNYDITGQTYTAIDGTKRSVDGTKSSIDSGNVVLNAIKGLQDTANAQLILMTAAFDVTNGRLGSTQNVYGNSANVSQATSTTGAVVQNQMVQALNKIVWNTFVIANNTSLSVPQSGGSGPGHLFGTYATGGVIPAHGLGLVSEHLNPTFVRAGSEPITVSPFPAQPSFRGSNDNGRSDPALLAEIRELNKKIERLEKTVATGSNGIIQTTYEAGEKGANASKESGRAVRDEMRMRRRDQRAANG